MSFCSLEDAFGQPFYYNTLNNKTKRPQSSSYDSEITCENIIDHITGCEECMAKFINKRNYQVSSTQEASGGTVSKNIENFINLGISSSKMTFFKNSDNILMFLVIFIFAYLVARKK